jgi:hypothetical protein
MFGRSKFEGLHPPPAALKEGGTEIFRAVIVNNGLQVSLRRGFDDPAMWGLLLADIARHAARIYASESVMSEAEALARIRKMYAAEMTDPTDLGTTKPASN